VLSSSAHRAAAHCISAAALLAHLLHSLAALLSLPALLPIRTVLLLLTLLALLPLLSLLALLSRSCHSADFRPADSRLAPAFVERH